MNTYASKDHRASYPPAHLLRPYVWNAACVDLIEPRSLVAHSRAGWSSSPRRVIDEIESIRISRGEAKKTSHAVHPSVDFLLGQPTFGVRGEPCGRQVLPYREARSARIWLMRVW